MPKAANYLAGILCAIIACLVGYQYWTSKTLADSMMTWPHTSGVITTFDLALGTNKRGEYYEPHLTYQFNCKHNLCGGKDIAFPAPRKLSQAESAIYKDRYAVGKQVQVYYNPNQPSQSCLEPSPATGLEMQLWLTMALALGAVVLPMLPAYKPY